MAGSPNNAVEFAVERPTVLVVDDEAAVVNAVTRVLRYRGVTVLPATSPTEARALLAQHDGDVHVAISDRDMPDEDGVTFLRWLREERPAIRRVLFTGHSDLSHVEHAVNEAGIHQFMLKPWRNSMLVELVRQAVHQWHLESENRRLFQTTVRQRESLLELTEDLEAKVAQRTALLEKASQTWKRTFDSIADPLTLIDRSFRIRRANLAAARVAEEDIRSLIGRTCYEALFRRSEACSGCPLVGEELVEHRTVEISDGRSGRIWVMNTWQLMDGVPLGEGEAVCHYREVTKDRALQRQVILLEKLAAVGELAGCVAHELNNPLTGILTFSQLMQRGLPPDDVVGLATDIEAAARRCSNIVQSLLDFARPGSANATVEPIDLVMLIGECINLARLQGKRGGELHLLFDPPGDLPLVMGNADALKSLFLNLINNAIQAMEHQGTVQVLAEVIDGGGQLSVRVQDTGPGVDEAIIDNIFEPFFTTKAKNRGGTGLGLAIVNNVVRDHGGRVFVHNRAEGGACFTAELPVAPVGESA